MPTLKTAVRKAKAGRRLAAKLEKAERALCAYLDASTAHKGAGAPAEDQELVSLLDYCFEWRELLTTRYGLDPDPLRI